MPRTLLYPAPHLRTTPPRPWAPLSDVEWCALMPYVWNRAPQGRQVGDLRARMDAIFHLATTGAAPWKDLPERFGKPDTVSRFFRRLTHNRLWHKLLEELAEPDYLSETHPLRRIEYFIVRACRRAARTAGLGLTFLIRRLGLRCALNGPPWMVPDQYLSAWLWSLPILWPLHPNPARNLAANRARLRTLVQLHATAGGLRPVPRILRLCW